MATVTRLQLRALGAQIERLSNKVPGRQYDDRPLPAGTRAKVSAARKHLAAARAALYQAAEAPQKRRVRKTAR